MALTTIGSTTTLQETTAAPRHTAGPGPAAGPAPAACLDSLQIARSAGAAVPSLGGLAPAVHTDGSFRASDGRPIAYRVTQPAGPVQAVVVMQMGTLGEARQFDAMAEQLAARGIKAYAVGSRVETSDYRQHARDLEQLVTTARQANPGQTVTVMGVSLGAAIALDWSARHNDEHAPVVAMAPVVLNRFLSVGETTTVMAGLVSEKAAAKRVGTPMSAGVPLTTNPASSEAAANLRYPETMTVPARLFGDVLRMNGEVAARGHRMQGPLLVAMAGDDKVAVNPAANGLAHAINAQDRTIRTFPGLAHDMSQETNHPEFVQALGDWILAHR